METGRRRQWRTREEWRRLVEESLKPGTSVARVARAHDVNANQLFKWRKRYRDGQLPAGTPSPMLPVRIDGGPVDAAASAPRGSKPGLIDIDLGHARIRIEGVVDPACVKAALEGLRR